MKTITHSPELPQVVIPDLGEVTNVRQEGDSIVVTLGGVKTRLPIGRPISQALLESLEGEGEFADELALHFSNLKPVDERMSEEFLGLRDDPKSYVDFARKHGPLKGFDPTSDKVYDRTIAFSWISIRDQIRDMLDLIELRDLLAEPDPEEGKVKGKIGELNQRLRTRKLFFADADPKLALSLLVSHHLREVRSVVNYSNRQLRQQLQCPDLLTALYVWYSRSLTMRRICAWCGKPFKQTKANNNQKCCTEKHRNAWYQSRYRTLHAKQPLH